MARPESVFEILKKISGSDPVLRSLLKEEQLKIHWQSLVGKKLSEHSQPDKVKGEVLWVRTEHPAWGQELLFLKQHILGKLSELDSRYARVKDIRFLQSVSLVQGVEKTEDASVSIPKQPCRHCGFLSETAECALCRNSQYEREKSKLAALFLEAPWLNWEQYIKYYPKATLTADDFSEIRRNMMHRLKDDLDRWRFEFSRNGSSPLGREKARKIAVLYATIKLARRPDNLSPQDVRGALGSWRFDALFK